MRNFILILLFTAACLAFIITGHLYWERKIDATVQAARAKVEISAKQETETSQTEAILARAKQLPAAAQAAIKRAVEEKRPIRLVIAGSESTPENGGWPDLLKQALDKAYGKGVFHITVHEYEGLTTADADRQRIAADWAKDKPDLVLLEPFLLNDNGVVTIDDTLAHIQSILAGLKSAAPNAVVILQPPNPIYNATYYPRQVERLEAFANENGYPYLNHWPAWPDDQSEELNRYVDPQTDLPTAEGANVWANALAKRFIAQ
ncbi:SGNH/GDSL hydrolase family protein [Geobacillus sp. FSL K6-0789]|uniref:SGNH/GDSL hydrolase family protein n=1 Tax=Geobacillus stearothermophilus TaxID=1422 RepID=A0A3L7DCN0_GEOSE|nr:SGNH/GDSL hydrolase family protein [Geobacillus stearothermophilus]RLQ07036.1 SGNH/GDSL hydrolase family protein [Geobacillus stearothermophilus]RLQ08447.1 SGNH/GDSL hydrolase family protein [Geobacillus stearothermophilus]RLQ13481.1 SGNH/GDSL hydrolase family protein [Geobacillus stearothermophilus]